MALVYTNLYDSNVMVHGKGKQKRIASVQLPAISNMHSRQLYHLAPRPPELPMFQPGFVPCDDDPSAFRCIKDWNISMFTVLPPLPWTPLAIGLVAPGALG